MAPVSRRPGLALAAGVFSLLLATAACDEAGTTGPDARGQTQLTREITFEDFENVLNAGEVVRVEIELLSAATPLIAHEAKIKEPEKVAEEEEIKSRIVDIDPSGTDCAGTLALSLDGIEVRFSSTATDFELDDDGGIACEEFVGRVEAELSAGRQPRVEAKRHPLVEDGSIVAQGPADGRFDADKLELEDEDDGDKHEMEINVDDDNLGDCTAITDPDCLGTLQVMGLVIVLKAGVTELKQEVSDEDGKVEFEGIVESVAIDPDDADLGSVTLTDGRVILIVAGTKIENESGDDDHLGSLGEVKQVISAGATVKAEAEGTVDAADPSTLIAIEAEFEIEDHD